MRVETTQSPNSADLSTPAVQERREWLAHAFSHQHIHGQQPVVEEGLVDRRKSSLFLSSPHDANSPHDRGASRMVPTHLVQDRREWVLQELLSSQDTRDDEYSVRASTEPSITDSVAETLELEVQKYGIPQEPPPMAVPPIPAAYRSTQQNTPVHSTHQKSSRSACRSLAPLDTTHSVVGSEDDLSPVSLSDWAQQGAQTMAKARMRGVIGGADDEYLEVTGNLVSPRHYQQQEQHAAMDSMRIVGVQQDRPRSPYEQQQGTRQKRRQRKQLTTKRYAQQPVKKKQSTLDDDDDEESRRRRPKTRMGYGLTQNSTGLSSANSDHLTAPVADVTCQDLCTVM